MTSVVEDFGERVVELSALPIGIHGAGRSATVTYTSPGFWQDPGDIILLERGEPVTDELVYAGFNPVIPPRLLLYPPSSNLTSVPDSIVKCVFTHV